MLEFRTINNVPHAKLEIGDGEFIDLHWGNTTLYTHRKQYEEVDHIFWATKLQVVGDLGQYGMYLFRQQYPEFDEIVFDLMGRDFDHIHSHTPSDHDIDMWVQLNVDDVS